MTFGHPNNECHWTLHTVNFLFCFTVAQIEKCTEHTLLVKVSDCQTTLELWDLWVHLLHAALKEMFFMFCHLFIHIHIWATNGKKISFRCTILVVFWLFDLTESRYIYIFYIYCLYILNFLQGEILFLTHTHTHRGAATHETNSVRGRCLAQRLLDHSPTTSPHHALFGLSGIWTSDLRVSKPYRLSYCCLSYWHFYPCHNRKQLKPSNSINAYTACEQLLYF